jgi:butyryl-CoA dehydrogenase
MAQVHMADAMERIESNARKVIAAVSEGDTLRSYMAVLRRLGKHESYNTVALRQQIAQKVIEVGKYVVI